MVAYLLLKRFDETIDYNFAYSNVWTSKITDLLEVDDFIFSFKSIAQYIEKLN
ncbi:MAG: hypothetical protein KGD65_09325 [Candidatus Lokiarchaeota archaeon]|nr:hypothetical protein [Candidatus Lokiarchaeota archaeon]